jgi:sugar O-acyltransferase (sialic acid O-acetyltransferase NeuD family)
MKIKAVGLGAGGHARTLLDLLKQAGAIDVVGLLVNQKESAGSTVCGVPILGDDDELYALRSSGVEYAFLGVGSTGDSSLRKQLYKKILDADMKPLTCIHPRAAVASDVSIGDGAVVLACAAINAGVKVGVNVIVNTGVVIEHDCLIGDHAHIAPGSVLCGGVVVGDGAHVGPGATVLQGLSIETCAVVGAGAVVVKSCSERAVYAGVPAKLVG